MNNEDMSDVFKTLSNMLNSNNIPDNVKELINNIQASSSNSSNSNDNKDVSSNTSETSSSFNNNGSNDSQNSGIDMDTILKISKIVSKINNSQNDARANLLLSLKPYLKESRKNKVEQYVKLLNMSKVLEVISPNDNEKVK